MGIFNNETEEEKDIKRLLKVMKGSNLSLEWRDYLTDYVTKVYKGEIVNDFYNFDYMNRILLQVMETVDPDSKWPNEEFQNILTIIKQITPEGVRTEDFEACMEMFINHFLGENGFIKHNLFDSKFYCLFENRYDFLAIMNIIVRDIIAVDKFQNIIDYALKVCPYCSDQQVLKHELIAFIGGLRYVYNFNDYEQEMLQEAKKRCGIYPIDEAMLASITTEAEKAQKLIAKLEKMQKKIDSYQERIKIATETGKKDLDATAKTARKDIADVSSSSIVSMNEMLDQSKTDIISKLDEYILMLEERLETNSNTVFHKILIDAQEKIREIRLAASGLSNTATSELIRIQTAADESVNHLKEYVENDEKLQMLLKGSATDEKIMSALLQLHADAPKKEEISLESTGASIIIPGYDRVVSPANPSVVIPSGDIPRTIIPAFDESIPFDKRMENVLKVKEQCQANGEIFHDMTDEIIRCILEGDWVYLWGPSGCGKSHSIKQAAKLIGIDMLDNGKITDKYSIMAYNDPQGKFRATQAFVALVYGKILLLDEFDNGNPDTQVVLNELYSGLLDTLDKTDEFRYVTFAEDMRVPIHPNFRMIAAGNTAGEGENMAFSSRGKIDESVQQRMTPKRFWYDNRVEEQIFGDYRAWYNLFVNFRTICDDYAERQGLDAPIGVVTTRDASAIVKYIRHNSKSVEQVMDEKFVQTKVQDYLEYIMKSLKNMYDISSENVKIKKAPLAEQKEIDLAKALLKRCNDLKR